MKLRWNVGAVIVVAALAFVAGRIDLPAGGESTAKAAPQDPGVTAEMEAMIKAGTPGPNHQYLSQLVGNWDCVFRGSPQPDIPAMESTGTISRTWILDGRYLREEVHAESSYGSFNGLGFLGYDNVDGQFQVIWMDNMSTTILTAAGSYDPDRKVMTFLGRRRDPASGSMVTSRSTLDLSDPARHVYVEYMTGANGKEFKAFEGVAERSR